ncbi:MAG: hypothetical protein WBG38_11280 [Nodosilinea sp.]
MQLLGHTYLNLEDSGTAKSLFDAAIQAAEAGHYLQIKANALVGLGRMKSQRGDLETAAEDCRSAIALLHKVGAYCDLATAHLQYALTLASMPAPVAGAENHLYRALELFQAIPAAQQVAKARLAWAQQGKVTAKLG